MDKQIKLDGIDVSGCDRLNIFPMQFGEPHEICLTSLEQWGGQEKYCKDRPNCYYKQLKRKEQECERLNKWLPIVTRLEVAFGSIETEKAKAIDYNTYAVEIFRKLDQLEKENKELRQLLSKEPLALQALQRAYSSYKKSTDEFYKMAKDYKQALTEIKEICGIGIVNGLSEEQYLSELRDWQAQILNKISEVKDVSSDS